MRVFLVRLSLLRYLTGAVEHIAMFTGALEPNAMFPNAFAMFIGALEHIVHSNHFP